MNQSDKFKNIEEAAHILKVIANQKRLMILCQLGEQELTVSEQSDFIDLSQSALSQHLAIMRQYGIVKTRRDGQKIYYALASPVVKEMIQVLYNTYCAR